MNLRLIFAVTLFFASLHIQADDVVRDVAKNSPQSSAYAEIGLALSAARIPLFGFGSEDPNTVANTTYELDLVLEGRFQYKRFFAEVIEDSFSIATIGFSIYDNDRASLELIATNYFLTIERNEIEGLETIEDRPGDISLGFRSSHFFNSNLIQVEVVSDVVEHKGVVGAIHFGRQKQIRNWSFYGLAGLRYFSEDAIDHLLGVSANEATDSIREYEPDSAVVASLQLGATLPLSENWTFNARAEYGKFSQSIVDSPLARGDDMYVARVGINYVLFN